MSHSAKCSTIEMVGNRVSCRRIYQQGWAVLDAFLEPVDDFNGFLAAYSEFKKKIK